MARTDVMDPSVYWNPEQYGGSSRGTPRKSAGGASAAAQRTRELARENAQRSALMDSVRNKFLQNGYRVGVGVHREGAKLTLQQLNKLGLNLPNEVPVDGLPALPVGIDPGMLTPRELKALGLPTDISMTKDDSYHEMPAMEISASPTGLYGKTQ